MTFDVIDWLKIVSLLLSVCQWQILLIYDKKTQVFRKPFTSDRVFRLIKLKQKFSNKDKTLIIQFDLSRHTL